MASTQLCLQALYYAISIHASAGGGGFFLALIQAFRFSNDDDDDDDDGYAPNDEDGKSSGGAGATSYTEPLFMALFVLFNAFRTFLPLIIFWWCLRKVIRVADRATKYRRLFVALGVRRRSLAYDTRQRRLKLAHNELRRHMHHLRQSARQQQQQQQQQQQNEDEQAQWQRRRRQLHYHPVNFNPLLVRWKADNRRYRLLDQEDEEGAFDDTGGNDTEGATSST